MISIGDIESARTRISPYIRRTPILPYSNTRANDFSSSVTLKLELLQASGSFKARGAMNRILLLSPEERGRGVVTASGGNHGLALARSAQVHGMRANIFLPKNVAPDKVRKLRSWGAQVSVVGEVWDEANTAALSYASNNDAIYVHPFADHAVVAGQGTLGLDILEDIPTVDTILVAIGGGGLISGLSVAIKSLRQSTRIIGIEPTGSPTLRKCLEAGRLVALERLDTRVATMSCRQTVQSIYETVAQNVDDIVLVSDSDMELAAKTLWLEFGIAADLSGAAAVAALMTGLVSTRSGSQICALVCGAGIDGMAA